MSWTEIKGLKEQRAKAFAEATALRTAAGDNDLSAEQEQRHAALLGDVEKFGKRIELIEREAAIGEKLGSTRSLASDVSNTAGMPDKDLRGYSLRKAIVAKMEGRQLDGLEAEVSREIEIRTGKTANGFYIPMSTRAFDTSAGTGGVGVNLMPDVIELLRNKLVTAGLGATLMTDMHGKFSLPRQSGAATSYWVAESGAVTASAQTVNQVAFTPKTVGALTDISRQLMNQASFDAEAFVRNDLAAVLARAIDSAALVGTGSSNQPTGIVNTSGINAVSHGTNGSAETWAKIVEYETGVLASNVDPTAKLAYVGNSKINGALKVADKTAGNYGQFILTNDGKVNGYNFAVTNALPSNGTKGTGTNLSTMIFGNWADLVIATWGGLDIVVDPYTGSSSGTVRIVALQDCDIQVRHPLSFAVATDIIA